MCFNIYSTMLLTTSLDGLFFNVCNNNIEEGTPRWGWFSVVCFLVKLHWQKLIIFPLPLLTTWDWYTRSTSWLSYKVEDVVYITSKFHKPIIKSKKKNTWKETRLYLWLMQHLKRNLYMGRIKGYFLLVHQILLTRRSTLVKKRRKREEEQGW